jgi:AraC family transcriptional regulator of adaptative response / DNA-3-methyladenine glycosylase II
MTTFTPPGAYHAAMHQSFSAVDDDACYRAFQARDVRFDGHFFTGVTSTGIYCRPVCKVRTPRRENCRFFLLAAQAEAAGFRPCLRCRPEIAAGGPHNAVWSTQDASAILAHQAAALLDAAAHTDQQDRPVAAAAQRLGISERHLRRIFDSTWGISPLQYLQTQRLLRAKQLLTDARLPIAQVASLSGFGSVRRFNAVFTAHYRLSPSALRKSQAASAAHHPAGIRCKAAYRPPYDVAAMLEFLQQRSVPGLEEVNAQTLSYQRTLSIRWQNQVHSGWIQAHFQPEQHNVELFISASLLGAFAPVLAGLKALLDLDADPQAIQTRLGTAFPGLEGLRVPGTLNGFELGVRAILGQQITVAAARTLTRRLVQALGTPIHTGQDTLDQLFPDANQLSQASGETLGALGIVRQRQTAIVALAQAVADGRITLEPGDDPGATLKALCALPGIGEWTAHYIAMRALRWPDAFPSADVALHNALGVRQHPHPAREAERLSQAWRPWRSYAVLRAWHTLSHPPTPTP